MNSVDLHALITNTRVDSVEVARIRRDVPDPWQLRIVMLNGESRAFRAETLAAAADAAKGWLE